MSEIVAKFGGTSMAQPEIVADIVLSDTDRRYIVVSAPGRTEESGLKVTDLLIKYGQEIIKKAETSELHDVIVDRFDLAFSAIDTTKKSKLRDKLSGLLSMRVGTPEYYASLGERVSAEYFAEMIDGEFVDSPIRFKNGVIDRQATRQSILTVDKNIRENTNRPLIIPGFYGYEPNATIQLLGRGGSDRTAVILSETLNLDNENWTDVDGVFNADPREIKDAKVIPVLTRAEVREGAHGGSGVLQGDCIVDANGTDFAITLRNTFNLSADGTRILASRMVDPNRPVVAVSSRDLSEVHITDLGMADSAGYLGRILHEAGALGLSAEHFPVAQDSTTITFSRGSSSEDIRCFASAVEKNLLSKYGEITVDEDKAVVYVVGEALRERSISNPVLRRIIHGLGRRSLYFDDIVSNYRSPSLALLVDRVDRADVQRAIFDEFLM